jgi:carboxyl-terminal processing protease
MRAPSAKAVQTMLEIGKFIPFLGSDPTDAGALKLTIQKFYRIAGGSTQLRGVLSDI